MRQLNLAYLHSDALGYGRAGIELAKSLDRMGVTVYDKLLGAHPEHDLWNEGRDEGVAATACWFSYPTHAMGWYENQYAAVFTMWETSHLPETFRGVLDNFDQIIVPSQQNVELFGLWHPNVTYVPLGIDPDRWTPTKRQDNDCYFRILTSGSGPRKGVDLVQKAFDAVFPDGGWGSGPIPLLQIKSQKSGPRSGPRTETIIGRISSEDEVALYEQAHVYIQMSRGEGFGLQPLQAIAQACPTILTDAHGHEAFAQYGMGVSAKLEHNTKAGGYFSFGESGDWWEPNFDELCDWLIYTYDNYDDVKRDAWDAALLASNRFTWDNTAAAFCDVFPAGQLEQTIVPGRYREVKQRYYRVATTEVRMMEIAGTVHRFEPGRDYWEPADIKRFMFDAQWLDPSCLMEFDSGLTQEQVDRLPEYASHHEFCPHCKQQYNSGTYRP